MLEADRARTGARAAPLGPSQKAIALLEPVAAALDVGAPAGHRASRHQAGEHLRHRRPTADEMHVKVLDFGIAKVVQSAAELGSFTKTGGSVTSFTPAYGAPEQFSRTQGATGPWTDVFALALVMTELLTDGRRSRATTSFSSAWRPPIRTPSHAARVRCR